MAEEEKQGMAEEPPVKEKTSLGDSLTAAFEKAELEAEAPKETKEKAPPKEEVKAEPEEPEVKDSKSDEEEPQGVEHSSAETKETEKEEPKESKRREAPQHWSAEDRTAFSQLPEEAQEFVLSKDKQFQSGFQKRLDEERQRVEPLLEAVKPMTERGVDPIQAVKQILSVQQRFQSDPAGTIRELARMRGLDLVELGLSDDSSQQQPQQQPSAEQIEQQVMHKLQQQAQQQRKTQAEKIVREEISNTEKYPLMQRIGNEVLLQARAIAAQEPNADPREVIKRAYDYAAWVNPETRQEALQAERKKALEEMEAKRKEEADRAKPSKRPVKSSTEATKAPKKAKPNRSEVISDALDKYYGPE